MYVSDLQREFYQDKKILAKDGSLEPVQVVKGSVVAGNPMEAHQVDGISGATLTANGVNALLQEDLAYFNKYFKKIKGGK